MSELLPQIAGWIGSGLIFLTYIALTRKWIRGDGNLYQVQVLTVSLVYGYMNWRLGVIPAIPINVLFGCIATTVLLRRFVVRSRNQVQPTGVPGGRGAAQDEKGILGERCRCGSPCCKDRVAGVDEV